MEKHIKLAETKYPDTGCDIVTEMLGHQSNCLECPLPKCIEDISSEAIRGRSRRAWQRHEAMRNAYHVRKWPIAKIALEFNVSHRTIQRVLVEEREEVHA